jgi:hypothetical protein
MAAYSVVQKQLTDNFAVLVLLTPAEIEVGASIVVTNVDATFNGSFVVRALPEYLFIGVDKYGDLIYDPLVPIANQVLYAKTADNVERQAASGTVTITQTCTWINAQDLYDYLGIGVATQSDANYLTICAAAASQFSWRRRMESGYTDSLTTVPSQDVKLGAIMYGSAMYRARGSVESFNSFQDMGVSPVTGLNGIIRQLLGIDRPQVA